MNWQTFGSFLEMGGYGFFVWSGFGASLLGIAIEVIFLRNRLSASKRSRREN